jgi:hypothetical protein
VPTPSPAKLTALEILSERGVWRQVTVLDEIDGALGLHGWVHGQHITAADLIG